jgi:hypothetical protein
MESIYLSNSSDTSIFGGGEKSLFDMSNHTNVRGSKFGNTSIIDRMRGVESRGLFNTDEITLADQYADKSLDQRVGGGRHNVSLTDIYTDKKLFKEFHGLNTDGHLTEKENYQLDIGSNGDQVTEKNFLLGTSHKQLNSFSVKELKPNYQNSNEKNVSLDSTGYKNASLNKGVYDNVSINEYQDSENASLNIQAHSPSVYLHNSREKKKTEEESYNPSSLKDTSIKISNAWDDKKTIKEEENSSQEEEKTIYKTIGYDYTKESKKIKEEMFRSAKTIDEETHNLSSNTKDSISLNENSLDSNTENNIKSNEKEYTNFNTNIQDNDDDEENILENLKTRKIELEEELLKDNLSESEISIIKENLKLIKREIVKRSFR